MLKQRLAGLLLALATTTSPATAAIRPVALEAAGAADFMADVVAPYLVMQTALVNDDVAPVAAAARILQKGASQLGVEGQALSAAAAKAATARTLEAARAAFGDVSIALIGYADATRQPVDGKIVAFCPMANKSWVQSDGPIANPYYGKAMATCGSRTRTLPATR